MRFLHQMNPADSPAVNWITLQMEVFVDCVAQDGRLNVTTSHIITSAEGCTWKQAATPHIFPFFFQFEVSSVALSQTVEPLAV